MPEQNVEVKKLPVGYAIGYEHESLRPFLSIVSSDKRGLEVQEKRTPRAIDTDAVIDYNVVGNVIPFDPNASESYRNYLINKHKDSICPSLRGEFLEDIEDTTKTPKQKPWNIGGMKPEDYILTLSWIWEMKEEQHNYFKLMREFDKITRRLSNDNVSKTQPLYGYRGDGRTSFTTLIEYVNDALDHHRLGENPKFIKQLVNQFADGVPFNRTRITTDTDNNIVSDGATITFKKYLKTNQRGKNK